MAGFRFPFTTPHRYAMRLQDISAFAGHIAYVTLSRNCDGLWEVSLFFGEDVSTEHKITKFHNRDTPRTWKSLEKAVATLEQALGVTFHELKISYQKKVDYEVREISRDG
jgi:predicted secreted protein